MLLNFQKIDVREPADSSHEAGPVTNLPCDDETWALRSVAAHPGSRPTGRSVLGVVPARASPERARGGPVFAQSLPPPSLSPSMQNNVLPQLLLVSSPVPRGSVTRAMVQARTCELAAHAGRISPYVEQADYERAKRELTGETDIDRQLAVLDAPQPDSSARPDAKRATEFAHALAQ